MIYYLEDFDPCCILEIEKVLGSFALASPFRPKKLHPLVVYSLWFRATYMLGLGSGLKVLWLSTN